MSSNNENTLKLYELLRAEIQNNIQLNNKISLFSFSVTAAVLAFAVASEKAPLCLIPLLIMLPLAAKSAHYRKNQLVIASYLSIKIEPLLDGISWETDVVRFKTNKYELALLSVRNFEFVFEAIVCIILYIYFAKTVIVFDFLLGVSIVILTTLLVMCLVSSMPSRRKARFVSKWKKQLTNDIESFG